jgi:ABC-2 type transport system permease protein
MFQQFLAITRNTFIESIRQPIFVVMIMVGILFLLLNPQLAAYSMESNQDNKMLIDMSLSCLFMIGILLAGVTATGVLASELENKTVLTVVSKPVPRPIFVLGKYVGVAGATAVAYYVLSLIFILTIRHRVMSTASDHVDQPVVLFGVGGGLLSLGLATWANYYYRRVFSSTLCLSLVVTQTVAVLLVLLIDKEWHFQSPVTDLLAHGGEMGQVMVGLILIFEAVLILTAIAIAASTRLGQVMTLLLCIGVTLGGMLSSLLHHWSHDKLGITMQGGTFDSLSTILAAETSLHLKVVYGLAQLFYMLLPNLHFLWPADAITQGNAISVGHVLTVSAYAALYSTAMLALAVFMFQQREVG